MASIPDDPSRKPFRLWSKQGSLSDTIPNTMHPITRVDEYLQSELGTPELDRIYHHLWMAGLPHKYIKPLHLQRVLGRGIVISEELHLISHRGSIYIKPIPACLLHEDFFRTHVRGRENLVLGFLSSYLHLITHESDLRIANECHLFPEPVSWDDWLVFSQYLNNILKPTHSRKLFNNRYDFGDLRLDRLNLIMVVFYCKLLGYRRLDTTYGQFFHSFWSVVGLLVFAFSSTALSAFQVMMAGSKTPPLVVSVGFWFAVVVLCFLVSAVMLPLFVFLVIFTDNLLFSVRRGRA